MNFFSLKFLVPHVLKLKILFFLLIFLIYRVQKIVHRFSKLIEKNYSQINIDFYFYNFHN